MSTTRGHVERVRVYTDLLAEEMDLAPDDRDRLRWASLLHDIGKFEVHPDMLNKPGKPSAEEWDILRKHPAGGAEMVESLADWLGEWVLAVKEHHEKYDGTGYLRGLAGQEISQAARVVAVTDVFDVITSARSYKPPVNGEAVHKELIRSAGTHFDPVVVRAFMNVSMAKLRWVMGPLSWLADVPLHRRQLPSGTRRRHVRRSDRCDCHARVYRAHHASSAVSVQAVAADPVATITVTTSATPAAGNGSLLAVEDVVTTDEDTAVSIDVTANDSGGVLSVVAFDPASVTGGTVDCLDDSCIYTPPDNYSGSDTFAYTVGDGGGEMDVATMTVVVTPVNDTPSTRDDAESTPKGTSVIVYVLPNAPDVEGEGRTIVDFDAMTNSGGAVSCGTFCVYVPPSGFTGTDTFAYMIEDDAGNPSTAIVTIAVG